MSALQSFWQRFSQKYPRNFVFISQFSIFSHSSFLSLSYPANFLYIVWFPFDSIPISIMLRISISFLNICWLFFAFAFRFRMSIKILEIRSVIKLLAIFWFLKNVEFMMKLWSQIQQIYLVSLHWGFTYICSKERNKRPRHLGVLGTGDNHTRCQLFVVINFLYLLLLLLMFRICLRILFS